MEGKKKVNHFRNLVAWQRSHYFCKLVYTVTKHFPREEVYGLTSQLRRAAVSITSNITEGYGRYHFKDKVRLFYQARGSNTECQNQIMIAYELGYISTDEYKELEKVLQDSYRLLCGLISSLS